MSGSGGWTTDPTELLRWQLLPWIADQPENEPDTRPFLDDHELSETDLVAGVRALRTDGWSVNRAGSPTDRHTPK